MTRSTKSPKVERSGEALIEALQASPHRDLDIEPWRERMPVPVPGHSHILLDEAQWNAFRAMLVHRRSRLAHGIASKNLYGVVDRLNAPEH